MRRGFGLLGFLFTVIVLVIVGAIAYNVGWSQGLATHVPEGGAPAGAPYYYYGYHPFGFGFGFGLLWFLLLIFGLFWLFRLAFFGRRFWGGGWGPRGGGYYGGHGMPPGIEERMQEWHKRAHGEPTPTPPPPPTDQRNV